MASKLKQDIGLKVRAARKAKKLTQEGFAELIDRTPETISNTERGKTMPSIELLELISSKLDVPLSYFFEKTVPPTDTEKRIGRVIAALSPTFKQLALKQVEALAAAEVDLASTKGTR